MEFQLTHSILTKVASLQILGKSPVGFYLRVSKLLWELLPYRVRNLHPMRSYGAWLHKLVCLRSTRQQYFGTFFLRNRPALELIRRLAYRRPDGSPLKIAVLACSIGAEVYSILWALRCGRPALNVSVKAVDISAEVLKLAERGVYSSRTAELVGSSIFARLTQSELHEIFDWQGDKATVKPWLREGITWHLADVTAPDLIRILGPQDLVVASNFLCHMAPADAEKCLQNIGQLIGPGGYLCVSGVDLDIRTKVAMDLGWEPVSELMAEIHDGDPSVRADWPWNWWGLEPLDRSRHDWRVRYAAAFRISNRQR